MAPRGVTFDFVGNLLRNRVDHSFLTIRQVKIQYAASHGYWLVEIVCRDRNKLFFDTVCTLADLQYSIYHATIDSHPGA